MEYLLGLIALLLGGLVLTNKKKQSAEALLQNQATKEKTLEQDRDIAKNTGLLDAEEQKRKELENAPKSNPSDPADFFNKR